MNFNSLKTFFWIFVFAAVGFLYFLFKIRSRLPEPAKLDLKSAGPRGKTEIGATQLSKSSPPPEWRPDFASSSVSPKEKALNVFFNFNGHEWDAYEVLGIQPGCSFEVAERAYAKALSQVQSDSRKFIELAWEAIQTTYR